MSSEFNRQNLSCKSPQQNVEGDIHGYDLKNVHVKIIHDEKGRCTFQNLSTKTTGTYYSGYYKQQMSGKIDSLIEDGKGGLLIHVPAGSKSKFIKEEIQGLERLKKNKEIVDPSGELIALVDPETRIATAGPRGMYIGIDLMACSLNLGEGLHYEMGDKGSKNRRK